MKLTDTLTEVTVLSRLQAPFSGPHSNHQQRTRTDAIVDLLYTVGALGRIHPFAPISQICQDFLTHPYVQGMILQLTTLAMLSHLRRQRRRMPNPKLYANEPDNIPELDSKA